MTREGSKFISHGFRPEVLKGIRTGLARFLPALELASGTKNHDKRKITLIFENCDYLMLTIDCQRV